MSVQLPDAIQDFIKTRQGGVAANQALLTYCKREAFHASWRILLDDEFLEAYEWAIEQECDVKDLLQDDIGAALVAFHRIFGGSVAAEHEREHASTAATSSSSAAARPSARRWELLHAHYRRMCHALVDMEEESQVVFGHVVRVRARY